MAEMPPRRTHEFSRLHYVVFGCKRRDDLHGSAAHILITIHHGFGFDLRLFCIGSECHWFVSFAFRAVSCLLPPTASFNLPAQGSRHKWDLSKTWFWGWANCDRTSRKLRQGPWGRQRVGPGVRDVSKPLDPCADGLSSPSGFRGDTTERVRLIHNALCA